MREYRYVSRNEYRGFKSKVLAIIHELQSYLRANGKCTSSIRPVGSAKFNLVTWSREGGYDLDYQLVLQRYKEDDPRIIRKDFIEAVSEIAKEMDFTFENKVHVLKIITQDEEYEETLSCDIAIIIEECDCDQIIVYDKKNDRYIWNELPTFDEIEEKQELIKRRRLWGKLRDEYLKLKNNNNVNGKHSYQLRVKATNNIWKQYF